VEQQTVEVKFRGELVGSHGGQGLNDGMVRTFFPELAAAAGLD
jgi:hypothetical protein